MGIASWHGEGRIIPYTSISVYVDENVQGVAGRARVRISIISECDIGCVLTCVRLLYGGVSKQQHSFQLILVAS